MPSTNNYTWSSSSLLGAGAVGEVYVGHHLKTGESVAIKVMRKFPMKQLNHLLSLQDRELEVLSKLDHPNIVKLIDVEPEPERNEPNHGRKIIIMELCTGGSLFNLLMSPENIFGLDDKEFLDVLEGIALGMEKLYMENIVHRDIKPGNIMRYIGDDGRTTYKLIDFGAARELHTEQEFESIYGTEEYLHPGIYEKAFIDTSSEQSFKHSVDLWSIGATLYHVAAGQIPFQSYSGRKDKRTVYEIIANKQSGDISGIQERLYGPIVYSKHLPSSCIMSLGLRPMVEDLLGRLLENDVSKSMSFEEFFKIAKNIVNKNVVSVFDSNTTNILKIYVDSSCIFQEFQELLKDQSGVNPDKQMLLYENLDFVEQFGGDRKVMTCGEVIASNPVYLFHRPSNIMNLDCAKYNIPTSSSNFVNYSRCCCESLYYIRRNVAKCLLRQKLINYGAIMLIRFLSRKYDKYSMNLEHLTEGTALHQLNLSNFELLTSCVQSTHVNAAEKAKGSHSRQNDLYSEIEKEVQSMRRSSVELESGLQKVVNLWVVEKSMCNEKDCCLSKIDVAIKNVMEIRDEFLNNSKPDDMHTRFKCQKLDKYCNSAKSLIEGHCQVNSKMLVESFHVFLGSIWSQKEDLEMQEKKLIEQYHRHQLLFESMSESSNRLRQSLPSLKIHNAAPDATTKHLSVEEGRLVLRRRESVEKKYAIQLFSINAAVDNGLLSSCLVPLIEENNRLIDGVMKLVKRNLGISTNEGTDGNPKELSTYHGKQPAHDDRTLT